jgi:hypothetical protein
MSKAALCATFSRTGSVLTEPADQRQELIASTLFHE